MASDDDDHSDMESGSDGDLDSDDDMESELKNPSALNNVEKTSDADTEHEDESEDEDEDEYDESDLDGEEETEIDAPDSKCSYGVHLSRLLSKAELDDMTGRKANFEWEQPALDISGTTRWEGTGECFLKEDISNSHPDLEKKLYKHCRKLFVEDGESDFSSSRQFFFYSLCNSYRDILHCNKKPFYRKGLKEDSSIMDAYIMHALNHVFITRDLLSKNEKKMAKLPDYTKEEFLIDGGCMDQGFTRPKVLILLPLASIALRFVKRLKQLTPPPYKVDEETFNRFSDEFSAESVDKPNKPSDWKSLFGGNNNDQFMVGIKFTKKTVKLYNNFYTSDMILASPLGLFTKIGEAKDDKEKDVDYLSSIEVLVIDHADVILLQNWAYLEKVVKNLNQIPCTQHGTNIMRIRKWYLDGQAPFYRQTIILGSLLNPDINALFHSHCLNYQGKVRSVSEHSGVLAKVLRVGQVHQVQQLFERVATTSIVEECDARYNLFIEKVFPKINDSDEGGTMIISSYLEYVPLRNFLKTQNASYCNITEYTKPSDISRARNAFGNGDTKIMTYTERAHFYHRYKIRGVKNLVFYSLPEKKEFYHEIVNMLDNGKMECTVLFSIFDKLKLERIVGTSYAKRMISSDQSIFIIR